MIQTNDITKTYSSRGYVVHALAGVDLTIEQGDFVVVHGSSGSGKTTLLLALGGMLRPTSGTVSFRGSDLYSLSPRRRGHFRKQHIGFIFQRFFLLPYLTAFENISLALALNGFNGDRVQRVGELAARLGIAERLGHRPSQLSVGEQQRVAVARAIVSEPEIILADEPTGNLDRTNADGFANFLQDENRQGRTVVMVTHNEHMLGLGNRTVRLVSGKVEA